MQQCVNFVLKNCCGRCPQLYRDSIHSCGPRPQPAVDAVHSCGRSLAVDGVHSCRLAVDGVHSDYSKNKKNTFFAYFTFYPCMFTKRFAFCKNVHKTFLHFLQNVYKIVCKFLQNIYKTCCIFYKTCCITKLWTAFRTVDSVHS